MGRPCGQLMGQSVAASLQAPNLFTIGQDLTHMLVYTNTDEADVGRIQVGAQASFRVDTFPRETFYGRVSQVRMNAGIIQNVVTYPVVIESSNPGQKLRPNMTATITFSIEAKEDVLRLPATALRFVPLSAQVRPEDRHYLDVANLTLAAKRTAGGV